MKDLTQIEGIVRAQRAIEKELHINILSKIPNVSEKIVSDFFDYVEQEGKDLRIAITPCIILNYVDSCVYYRIIPLEAGALVTGEFARKSLFPSFRLDDFFDVKAYEIYDINFRKELCEKLANGIKTYLLKKVKCKNTVTHCNDGKGYCKDPVEYRITLNL